MDSIAGQVGELLSHNSFAYCKNNPINMCDPSGHFALPIAILAIAAIAIPTYKRNKKK